MEIKTNSTLTISTLEHGLYEVDGTVYPTAKAAKKAIMTLLPEIFVPRKSKDK